MTFYDPDNSKPGKCDFTAAVQMKRKDGGGDCTGGGTDCYFTCAWAPLNPPPRTAACYGGRQGGGWGGGVSTVDYFSVPSDQANTEFPVCNCVNNPKFCP